jgi:polyhydroxyalkanoate synthesis regulator phasin
LALQLGYTNGLPMEKIDGKEKRGVPEVFEKAWGQALLAVSTAEDEAAKVAARFAEVAGWGQEEVKRQVREFSDRLTTQRKDLERNVEEGVKRALSKMKVPRRDDLEEIASRLDKISARIDALTEGR